MIWVLIVKALAVGYAARGSMRAGFRPGALLGVPVLATIVLPAWMLFDSDGPLASFVLEAPWALPLVAVLVGAPLTYAAFGAAAREPAISPRVALLETASYGLLANTLIDAALLVLTAFAAILVGTGRV